MKGGFSRGSEGVEATSLPDTMLFSPDGVLGKEQCRPQRLWEETRFSARRRCAAIPGLLKKKHCAVTCLISRREMRIHKKKQSATKPKGSASNMEKREE